MNELKNRKMLTFNRTSIIVLAVLIVVLAAAFFVRHPSLWQQKIPTQENTNAVMIRTFESRKLGVRFTYADRNDLGQKTMVQESGDTIYVYPQGSKMQGGQFVQVFPKEKNETLKQAIERSFLQGYDPTQCYVQSGVDANRTPPKSGIAAIIAYPILEINYAWLENEKKCPPRYSLTNGLSYFWTDKEKPDEFVFFWIGQYYIPATSVGTSWHTTLEFVQ